MNKLLFSYLIAGLLLLVSCQKDELLPTKRTVDYRDQLVGKYKGSIIYKDLARSSSSDQSTVAKDIVENQVIEITKSTTQKNALIIDGNKLNLVTQTNHNENEYSDIFLYSAHDCSGTEFYHLTFYPNKQRLVLDYKHNRNCEVGVLKQNNTFDGAKL